MRKSWICNIFTSLVIATLFSEVTFFSLNAEEVPPAFSVMSDKIPEGLNVKPQVFDKRFFRNVIPTEKETKLGFIAGITDTGRDINMEMSEEKPVQEKEIRKFAAKGQYVIVTFIIECLDAQSEINMRCSDLKSEKEVIENTNLKVKRIINHSMNPKYLGDFLINNKVTGVPSGSVLQYCLFINVPENTMSGLYRGEITISSKNGDDKLPIILDVLDFTLPETNEYVRGLCLPGHFFPCLHCWASDIFAADKLEPLFRFWKTRKLNSPTAYMGHPQFTATCEDGKLTSDFSVFRYFAESMKKNGLSGPLCIDTRFYAWWALEEEKKNPKIKAEEYFSKAIRELVSVAEKEKWPPVLFIPEEEVGNATKIKIDTYTRFWKPLRNACQGRDYIIDNDIGYNRKEPTDRGNRDDFKIIQYNSWEEDALKQARDAGRSIWAYNYGFERISYGLLLQRLGATGYHQWADMFRTDDRKGNYVYCLFNEDGVISSLQYERAYEGINDYMYCVLLKNLNEKLKEKDLEADVKKNENILARIVEDIPISGPVFGKWKGYITDAGLDLRRWKLALAIEEAYEKLGKTPGAAVRLGAMGKKPSIQLVPSISVNKFLPRTGHIILVPLSNVSIPLDGIPLKEGLKFGSNSTGPLQRLEKDKIDLRARSSSEAEYKKICEVQYTDIWISYNREGLRLGVICNHVGSRHSWLAQYSDDDARMWNDDCMEFFFMLPDRKEYYQLIVNAKGNKVLSNGNKIEKSTDIKISTKYELGRSGAYGQEILIPWQTFGLTEMPKVKTVWKFNVGREFHSIKQYGGIPQFSSWSEVYATFHETDKWGTINFTGNSLDSMFEITHLGSCLPGTNSIAGKITVPVENQTDELTLKIFRGDGCILTEKKLDNAKAVIPFKIDFKVPIMRQSETWQLALLKGDERLSVFDIPVSGIKKSVEINTPPAEVIAGENISFGICALVSNSDVKAHSLCARAISGSNDVIDFSPVILKCGGNNLAWINTSGLKPGTWRIYLWLDKIGGPEEDSFLELTVLPSPFFNSGGEHL